MHSNGFARQPIVEYASSIFHFYSQQPDKQCSRKTKNTLIICAGSNELWKLVEAMPRFVKSKVQLFPNQKKAKEAQSKLRITKDHIEYSFI